jgi:hypothetical protein
MADNSEQIDEDRKDPVIQHKELPKNMSNINNIYDLKLLGLSDASSKP